MHLSSLVGEPGDKIRNISREDHHPKPTHVLLFVTNKVRFGLGVNN